MSTWKRGVDVNGEHFQKETEDEQNCRRKEDFTGSSARDITQC